MGKIIIILCFKVGTSRNKSIDYRVKETSAIMPTQVTYEIDLISLLSDLTISNALNVCFCDVFHSNLKEKSSYWEKYK